MGKSSLELRSLPLLEIFLQHFRTHFFKTVKIIQREKEKADTKKGVVINQRTEFTLTSNLSSAKYEDNGHRKKFSIFVGNIMEIIQRKNTSII